ncbi:synaptosomal-associated protein 29 [Agrilus planipennis]|uniref:Synaptosomal-associated protein 29 n=1 Tax=Agrilus planipennis TaxID=224129 RepID=A0A1W4XC39_AGRPL|nr:synaptosomal-associated protein 29 [Agrilus planipennis]
MSSHQYIANSENLFEEDVDDETFLRNSRRTYDSLPVDQQRQTFLEKRKEIEERTLTSTERSIGLLRESEQVGIATAEELMKQREQLERTDKQLDEINQSLRFSQKHINGIKSVFSSLKNYISGKNDQSPTPSSGSSNSKPSFKSVSQEKLSEYDRYDNHPSVRLRGTDMGSGNYIQTQSSGSKDFTARLDANLQEMHSNISRLKGLATDMSFEIDSQNDLIGNVTDKVEKADITINRQNKDMQRILKK